MPTASSEQPAGNTRNLYVFGVTSFLNDTASEMAYWILPAFLITLGAGPQQLGMIEGIAESVAASTKLFSGYLTDRFPRRKPLVVGGYVVANIAKPFLGLATAWWHVLLVRFADRTSKGLRGAPRDVMLAESVPQEKLGSAFGLLQAMDSAGAIAGPLIALMILRRYSVRTVFLMAALPGAATIAVSLFARETKRRGLKKPTSEDVNRISSARPSPIAANTAPISAIPRSFFYMLLAIVVFSVGNSSDMFLILRAQEVGIAVRYAPLLGLVFNAVYTAASWPAGHLSDKLPKRWIAALGYFIFAAVYLAFATAPSARLVWVAMGSYGLYYALTDPVLRALVMQTVPPEARGRALGIFYFATSMATLAASLLTGWLWKWKYRQGPVPLYISSGLALLAGCWLLLLSPEKKPTFAR